MYRGLYKQKSPNGTPITYMIGDTVLHEGKMYVALNQTQKSPLQSPRDWKFTNITEPYQNDDSPLSPEENQFWVDEGKNLYIRSFENGQFVWTLLSGSTLACWGSFWDTGNKGITSITAPYGITFGNSDPLNNGVSLTGGSRIVFSQTGVYNLQFSAQLMNTNNTNEQEATFWFRKNGADIPDSAGIGTISKQRGVDPGYSIIAYNLILPLVKDDFIEMYWHANSTDVTLHAYPAGASPVHPVAPSIIFTAHQLMRGAGSASIGGGGGGAGISGPYVISFNGLTGAVTGVTTGVANTFIPLQTFAAGISSLGGTFSRDIRVRNLDIGQKLSTDSIIIGNSPTMNGVFGGGNNVVIGYDIGSNSPTTVLNSVLMGYQAGQNASVINENVAIGMRSMRSVVNSPNNTAIGALSYQNGNTNDGYNTAVGYGALNTSNGGYNTAIGAQTLLVNNEGTYNVAIGYQSLFSNNNGARNVGIGADALYFNSDGNNNVALGYSSLYNNTTGQYNIGIGLNSLLTNESGSDNVSFGRESLKNGSNLSSNVAIGRNALTELTASEQNVGIGIGSLFNLYQFSNNNTAVGSYSGNGVVSATGGVYIGSFAKGISQGQINEIVIGTNAIGLGSHNTVIGATTQTVATIYGQLRLPGGLSAAGATFSRNISAPNMVDSLKGWFFL